MTKIRYYGQGNIPGFERTDLPGRLIVLEGTDGVGRSTQVALLHEWLKPTATPSPRRAGAFVTRGPGSHTRQAGSHAGRHHPQPLLCNRFRRPVEKEIIPALRAGFVCLTDRYIYSIIARAVVRGSTTGGLRTCSALPSSPTPCSTCRPTWRSWSAGALGRGVRLLGIRDGCTARGRISSRTSAPISPTSWRSSARSAGVQLHHGGRQPVGARALPGPAANRSRRS